MSVCSSYGSSSSLPILPTFLVMASILALALSMLGTGATVQIATPKQTPDPNRVGGIEIDKAVQEARQLIPKLKQMGDVEYINSTGGGLLRVYRGWEGQLYIVGHDNAPSLLAAAEKIAEQLGAIVGP